MNKQEIQNIPSSRTSMDPLWKNFMDNVDLGIVIVYMDGRIIYSNKKFQSIIGYTGSEIEGLFLLSFVSKSHYKSTLKEFGLAAKTTRVNHFYNKYDTKQKESVGLHWASVVHEDKVIASCIPDDQGVNYTENGDIINLNQPTSIDEGKIKKFVGNIKRIISCFLIK